MLTSDGGRPFVLTVAALGAGDARYVESPDPPDRHRYLHFGIILGIMAVFVKAQRGIILTNAAT